VNVIVCVVDQDIVNVFTSFSDWPVELGANKTPSIIIMGGQSSSRVAVANRLLGPDVLPAPCHSHTLQFVDTDCVHSFDAAANSLWSWVNNVPIQDLEAQVVSVVCGDSESEIVPTVPVVNILMSHPVLRAGSHLAVCGDHSAVSTVQFAVTNVIPIIIFVVSRGELSEKVCAVVVLYLVISC